MNTLTFFIAGYTVFALLFFGYMIRLQNKQKQIQAQIKELRKLLS